LLDNWLLKEAAQGGDDPKIRKVRGKISKERDAPQGTWNVAFWKSGQGGRVRSREQAIAIGLYEARKRSAKLPRKILAHNRILDCIRRRRSLDRNSQHACPDELSQF